MTYPCKHGVTRFCRVCEEQEAGRSLAPAHGSEAAVELEVVPQFVNNLADAYERGKTVIGGMRMGKTWAMRIATAKPHQKQLPPNAPHELPGAKNQDA